MRHDQKWRILAILEIDGYQLSVPPRKKRTFFVLAAKFMILSRSVPGRSTSLLSLDTSGEPGEFSIELPLRILVIDRTMDELVAVCCGPAHPSLGKECSQHDSRPVVLETAVASENRPNDTLAGLWVLDQQTNFGLGNAVADHGLDPASILVDLRCLWCWRGNR